MNARTHCVAGLVLALTGTGYLLAQNAPSATPAGPGQGRTGAPAAAPVSDTSRDPVVRPPNGAPVFADDFEASQLDSSKWTTHMSGEQTIGLTTEKVAHGTQALKVHYPAGAAGSTSWAFVGTLLPASLRDHLYGRAYVYIGGLAAAHNVYLNAGTTGFPISDFLEIGSNGGNFMISYQQNAPADGHPRSETTARQGTPPIGRWFCLEWELTNKPENRITLWVDGTLVANKAFSFNPVNPRDTEARLTSGLVAGGFTEFNVGFRAWSRAGGNMADTDIYYDDIAIGDKPIGQLTSIR